ncbi:hypothetical protein MAP00_005563 [Monascus purpureus]|nr:hypothetical protein MAP00_005563 [Monascus purpureus]
MPTEDIKDRHGQNIREGDWVATQFPRGSRQGEVEAIAKDKSQAEHEGVNHPPRVSVVYSSSGL